MEASIYADLAPAKLENDDSEDSEDSVERVMVIEDEDEDEDKKDDEKMADELKRIKKYLLIIERPVGMSDKVYDSLRQFALKFLVHKGLLFCAKKST